MGNGRRTGLHHKLIIESCPLESPFLGRTGEQNVFVRFRQIRCSDPVPDEQTGVGIRIVFSPFRHERRRTAEFPQQDHRHEPADIPLAVHAHTGALHQQRSAHARRSLDLLLYKVLIQKTERIEMKFF